MQLARQPLSCERLVRFITSEDSREGGKCCFCISDKVHYSWGCIFLHIYVQLVWGGVTALLSLHQEITRHPLILQDADEIQWIFFQDRRYLSILFYPITNQLSSPDNITCIYLPLGLFLDNITCIYLPLGLFLDNITCIYLPLGLFLDNITCIYLPLGLFLVHQITSHVYIWLLASSYFQDLALHNHPRLA